MPELKSQTLRRAQVLAAPDEARNALGALAGEWRFRAGFTLPATHDEPALRLGAARGVAPQNLSRFQTEGMIRVSRGSIAIPDREAPRREAEAG